jgi:MinD-like ATPase involved in chromosome partitioning or flagellar assembly
MKTLMFYSYKGGSGRTVAAANVAAAFAKLGKRTAVVDLDFEAPGLHHVFGVEKSQICLSGLGIQGYLKGDIDLEQLLSEATIDMLAAQGPFARPRVVNGGELKYIVASSGVTIIDAADPDVGMRMKALRDSLEQSGTEILVIDAASGVREAYAIAYDACDEMVIFFRWSKQHVAGTLKVAEYLKSLRRIRRFRPFRLVASACPDQQDFEDVKNERLRNDLSWIKEDTEERICAKLKECEIDPPEVFYEIPEFLEMKWRESVIVFRDDNSAYERLARRLIDAMDRQPN